MQELKKISLANYTGTQEYHAGYLGVKLTDGSYVVGVNNASWLITDICSVLKANGKVKAEEFVSIKFKVNGDTAKAVYTDGNDKKLYEQEYKYTDFSKYFEEREIQFFFTDNVLMLASEY